MRNRHSYSGVILIPLSYFLPGHPAETARPPLVAEVKRPWLANNPGSFRAFADLYLLSGPEGGGTAATRAIPRPPPPPCTTSAAAIRDTGCTVIIRRICAIANMLHIANETLAGLDL